MINTTRRMAEARVSNKIMGAIKIGLISKLLRFKGEFAGGISNTLFGFKAVSSGCHVD